MHGKDSFAGVFPPLSIVFEEGNTARYRSQSWESLAWRGTINPVRTPPPIDVIFGKRRFSSSTRRLRRNTNCIFSVSQHKSASNSQQVRSKKVMEQGTSTGLYLSNDFFFVAPKHFSPLYDTIQGTLACIPDFDIGLKERDRIREIAFVRPSAVGAAAVHRSVGLAGIPKN